MSIRSTTVLIVTNERDVGADFLVRELDQRGITVVRLNSERAPEWTLSLVPAAGWELARGTRRITSDDCVGVWWRRPEIPASQAEFGPASEMIADQWRAFLAALAIAPGPTWVSEPSKIRAAENKALQLRVAGIMGLLVPRTVWTNDVEAARSFIGECGGLSVVKSVTSAWWEEAAGASFVFASLVGPQNLPPAGRLAQTPLVFQRPVIPKRDVRVTVVEDVVLGAVRDAGPEISQEPIDWRRAPVRAWLVHELPPIVADACRELVKDAGLRFGAIDFAVDAEGNHWFLELNPNGEWGWLQRAGLPIAEALADTLTAGGRGE